MWIQHLLHKYQMREVQNFEKRKNDLEGLQRENFARLTHIYAKHGYARFSAAYENLPLELPILNFETRQAQISEAWKNQKNITWEATSGTTGGRKWIPYTSEFRHDLNRAASLWMGDLATQAPGILEGSHYWSLSWLPEELRKSHDNDDTHLMPAWQRWMYRKILTVPSTLQNLETSEDSWFATQIYLAHAKDLSLLSVWSPTFALRLAADISKNLDKIREEGQNFLREHKLPKAKTRKLWPATNDGSAAFYNELWPDLRVISCWDSATSAGWAQDLKKIFPGVLLQGKGLWATEGPVTVPYRGSRVLCAHSHFYEFRCLQTGRILPAWKLEKDQAVQPLLWSANGLCRYPLLDRMTVSGFEGNIPKMEFLGRVASTDLVGEKVEESFVAELLASVLSKNPGLRTGGIVAARDQLRYFIAVVGENHENLQEEIENGLLRNHHYKLARELNQLESAQVKTFENYADLQEKIGGILGQSKIETLRMVDTF